VIVCALAELVGVTVVGVSPAFVVVLPLVIVTGRPDGFEVTVNELAWTARGAGPPGAVQVAVVVVPLPPPLLEPPETAALPPPPPPPHAERPRLKTSPAAVEAVFTYLFILQSLS
jgi:hypothetical protein